MKYFTKLFINLFILIFFSIYCKSNNGKTINQNLNAKNLNIFKKAGKWSHFYILNGKAKSPSGKMYTGSGKYKIYLPKKYSLSAKPYPLLIGLPGWSRAHRLDSVDNWRINSSLTEYAEKYGFVIVLAEMSSTAYETDFFSETLGDFKWSSIPGTLWVGEVLMPFIQESYNVDKTGKKTGIFGLSTGGRGAVYILQKYPSKFQTAVSISGDFDRIALLKWTQKNNFNILAYDPPSATIYGNPTIGRQSEKDAILKRWAEEDNPSSDENIQILAANRKNVLILHGKADRIVDITMSEMFVEKLVKKGVFVEFHYDENGGHDWVYWKKNIPRFMNFFYKKIL